MVPQLLLFGGLIGCRGVDPAPTDLDGLIHFFWQNADHEDPETLVEAFETLHETAGAALVEVVDGNVSRLSDEEAALVDSVDADPADAAGIFMLNTFACTAEQLERILIHLEQDEIRDGLYTDYQRVYTSDADAYLDRSVDTITWETDIAARVLLANYTSELTGVVRRVDTDLGPAFVLRAWFNEPASFENGATWTQDYQLEIYYERTPGEIVHLYAMWREIDLAGFTSENAGVQRQVLNGMRDQDQETEAICAAGLP